MLIGLIRSIGTAMAPSMEIGMSSAAAATAAAAAEETRHLLGAGQPLTGSTEAAASATRRSSRRGCGWLPLHLFARHRDRESTKPSRAVCKPMDAEAFRRHRERRQRLVQQGRHWGHFDRLAANRQLVMECLRHYNSLHPEEGLTQEEMLASLMRGVEGVLLTANKSEMVASHKGSATITGGMVTADSTIQIATAAKKEGVLMIQKEKSGLITNEKLACFEAAQLGDAVFNTVKPNQGAHGVEQQDEKLKEIIMNEESSHSRWEELRKFAYQDLTTEGCSNLLKQMELEESDEEETIEEESWSLVDAGIISKKTDEVMKPVEKKRRTGWGPIERTLRPRRGQEDGRTMMQKAQELKKEKNLEKGSRMDGNEGDTPQDRQDAERMVTAVGTKRGGNRRAGDHKAGKASIIAAPTDVGQPGEFIIKIGSMGAPLLDLSAATSRSDRHLSVVVSSER